MNFISLTIADADFAPPNVVEQDQVINSFSEGIVTALYAKNRSLIASPSIAS